MVQFLLSSLVETGRGVNKSTRTLHASFTEANWRSLKTMSEMSRLFEPILIGSNKLSSRIIMGPLSSNLADEHHILDPSAKEYYGQRACVPGTLIIGEATFVSPQASGCEERRAGIWSQEQVAAWREVVDSVHKAGSYIFLQLWALGRSADPEWKRKEGTGDVVSSSAVPETEDGPVPRAMTEDEIWTYIDDHATGCKTCGRLCWL